MAREPVNYTWVFDIRTKGGARAREGVQHFIHNFAGSLAIKPFLVHRGSLRFQINWFYLMHLMRVKIKLFAAGEIHSFDKLLAWGSIAIAN